MRTATRPVRQAVPRPPERLRLALVVLGASCLVVLVVVGGVLVREKTGFVVRADNAVEAAAHRAVLGSSGLLAFARAVTHAGDSLTRYLVSLVVVVFLARRRLWRLTAFYAVAVFGGQVVVDVVKVVVGRARPALPAPVAHAAGPSFPSGHAMGSTILYGGIVLLVAPLLTRLLRWLVVALAFVLVGAVCASRVLLGVHYLSDVVAGFVVGLAWLALTVGVFETWRRGSGERPVGDPLVEGLEPAEQERLAHDHQSHDHQSHDHPAATAKNRDRPGDDRPGQEHLAHDRLGQGRPG
jgi:undecaprenyl-diphosphatase